MVSSGQFTYSVRLESKVRRRGAPGEEAGVTSKEQWRCYLKDHVKLLKDFRHKRDMIRQCFGMISPVRL